MSESFVLTLDGSTEVCSAALLRSEDSPGGEVPGGQGADRAEMRLVASRSEDNSRGQARVLLSLVDEMLQEVGAGPADLGSVVVGTGPGTFTGVRIAVATARGIALALGVPVFGVSTLAALAASALETASDAKRRSWVGVVPVIDARRQQVFFSVYERCGPETDGAQVRLARTRPIGVCDRGEVVAAVGGAPVGPMVVAGSTSELVGELRGDVEFVSQQVRSEYLVLGQGRLLEGEVAEAHGETENVSRLRVPVGAPETVKPIYVRAPDADLHIKKMKDPWAGSSG